MRVAAGSGSSLSPFASALGPGFAGLLIDAGADLDLQAFGHAACCGGDAVLYLLLLLRPRFRARVKAAA